MQLADAIHELCRRDGITQAELSRKAGFKYVTSLSTPMRRGNMTIETLMRIANAVGYDVILFRRDWQWDADNIIVLEPSGKTKA